MYFVVVWYDPRVIINDTDEFAGDNSNLTDNETFVPISFKHLNKVWKPDIEIYGMTDYFTGKILQPQASFKLNRMRQLQLHQ